MMYRIEHEGRIIMVASLTGYEDCPVIESDVPMPPGDPHWYDRVDGQWVERTAERELAEENARLAAMSPVERQAEAVAKAQAQMAAALGIELPPAA
jgi:hypothetical protein